MLLSIYTNFGNLKNFHQNRLVSADRKGLNPADELLLQKLVNVSFADISRHRSESVASALQWRETYDVETPNKPSLTTVEKSIVAYITGYVGRKKRDRLQRHRDASLRST